MNINFQPSDGVGIPVSAEGVAALGAGSAYQEDALIDNRGSVDAYVRFGDASISASVATSLRIPSGAMMIFNKRTSTHIAVAVASGTPDLVIHLGRGQ